MILGYEIARHCDENLLLFFKFACIKIEYLNCKYDTTNVSDMNLLIKRLYENKITCLYELLENLNGVSPKVISNLKLSTYDDIIMIDEDKLPKFRYKYNTNIAYMQECCFDVIGIIPCTPKHRDHPHQSVDIDEKHVKNLMCWVHELKESKRIPHDSKLGIYLDCC